LKAPVYCRLAIRKERFIVLAYSGSNLPAEDALNVPATAFRASEGISVDVVRSEIERICSSPEFQANVRRRTLLRFIVEETLSGRAGSLKGYTIALAVFGRDESFDPQADPVVRLEARRLRRDLDSYYMDAGQDAPIRIRIPKGSYVPSFEWRKTNPISHSQDASETEALPAPDGNSDTAETNGRPVVLRRSLIAAALVGLAIALAFWISPFGPAPSLPSSSREPGVLITPFEALSAGENARNLAAGMGQELTGSLFQLAGFRLYTSSAASNQEPRPTELARKIGASYIISGSVQTDVEEVRVTTSVMDATSGELVWTRSYSRPFDPQSLVSTQRKLADEIAEVIGQPYGVVRTDMSQRPSAPSVSSMDSYMCVLRGYGYRRTFLRAEFEPAMTCLEQAVERDPKYSDAWAMLGWLHVDAGRLSFIGDDQQREFEKARTAISRAVELQPKNPLALKALAAVHHFTGRYEDSVRLTRQLVDLYPNDPEILAQLGWRLSVRGDFEEGVPALKRAIDRTLNPPNWYFHFIAVNSYLQGEYEEARRIAERAALGDSGFSQLILAASNARLGDRQGTQQALEKLARYEPLVRDTEGFLYRQGVATETVRALLAGLERARANVSQQ
jgi:TolB-like protein/tetratricopeptide (TPR) repeat protein